MSARRGVLVLLVLLAVVGAAMLFAAFALRRPVTERGAMDKLIAVAEALGAPVITESGTTHGRLAFPSDHPLNGQGLPLWSPEVRKRLEEYDVLLVVGVEPFSEGSAIRDERVPPAQLAIPRAVRAAFQNRLRRGDGQHRIVGIARVGGEQRKDGGLDRDALVRRTNDVAGDGPNHVRVTDPRVGARALPT